jgi:hypothetical protein
MSSKHIIGLVVLEVSLILCATVVPNSYVFAEERISREYYPSGALKAEWYYQDRVLDGISRQYYENGQLKTEQYYENGHIRFERNYRNGELDGLETYYNDQGMPRTIFLYDNGRIRDSCQYESCKSPTEIARLEARYQEIQQTRLTNQKLMKTLKLLAWIFAGVMLIPGISLSLVRLAHYIVGAVNPVWFGVPPETAFPIRAQKHRGVLSSIRGGAGIDGVIGALGIIPASVFFTGILSVMAGITMAIVVAEGELTEPLLLPFLGIASALTGLTSIGVLWKFRARAHGVGDFLALMIGGIPGVILGAGSGWVFTGLSGVLTGVCYGLLLGILYGIVAFCMALLALSIGLVIDKFLFPVLALLFMQQYTVICANCLRYTEPMKSRYDKGKRYCEHCQAAVERTPITGKVIFVFGNFSLQPGKRQFICENPTFGLVQADIEGKLFFRSRVTLDQREQPVDVSEVYIDASSCEPHLIERFLTFIVNFPPKKGIHSVRIFHRGELDDLGVNLKNALHNTFSSVSPVA